MKNSEYLQQLNDTLDKLNSLFNFKVFKIDQLSNMIEMLKIMESNVADLNLLVKTTPSKKYCVRYEEHDSWSGPSTYHGYYDSEQEALAEVKRCNYRDPNYKGVPDYYVNAFYEGLKEVNV